MIIEPPKTVQDFEKVLSSIFELMANPYCDHLMFDILRRKRDNTLKKIEEVKAESK
jgi:hypothetical protein